MSLSLFTFNNYWGIDATNQAAPVLAAKDGQLAQILKAEAGFSREMYDLKTALAIVDKPEDQREAYEKELDKLALAKVPVFRADVKQLTDIGFTFDEAQEFAKNKVLY
eukprot:TRINITY_DN296_c0_g1_i9.p1 TRINITY_DN296_c0_g1~~TRINITY_DN296_c0_g1_i9.p1  ORF type:complete len:108 (+),score=15.69 TRINITY_DN296_c0_g1_i9:34-357(+)